VARGGFLIVHPDVKPPLWVAVLLDWQNIYKCAREAFGFEDDPSVAGTVHPLKLARHFAAGVEAGRQLQEVRIYRGRPDNQKDPRSYSAWRSQTAAWQNAGGSQVVGRYRDLRYRGGVITEKGIDVWLAVDLIHLAMDQGADRVVVASSDTDLVPALELAVQIRGSAFVEVAGWDGPNQSAALLTVKGVRKHRLDRMLYDRLHDPTDYNVSARSRAKGSWDSQIQAEGKRRRRRT
jgi:uncharacterized LabA/DUF88 family protein